MHAVVREGAEWGVWEAQEERAATLLRMCGWGVWQDLRQGGPLAVHAPRGGESWGGGGNG